MPVHVLAHTTHTARYSDLSCHSVVRLEIGQSGDHLDIDRFGHRTDLVLCPARRLIGYGTAVYPIHGLNL